MNIRLHVKLKSFLKSVFLHMEHSYDTGQNIQSTIDYSDSLGLDKIVWIIEDMNINKKRNGLN